MSHNRIVIFSNGIADFQRRVVVRRGEPTHISIPVRTDHVADVLASLNLYGRVAVVDPPSYRPTRGAEGGISIDPEQALEDLATTLSGARVAVERPGGTVDGLLVGLHTEPEGKLDERIFPKSLVILTGQGFARVPLRELQRLRFEDEAVRDEIAKALDRSRQQIRPRSTVIELAVRTEENEAEAIVQYTVPAAAWKISYRLRVSGGAVEFQGFALVDNNTEEPWTDCLIAVVTGEPITFSTDLAESKIPQRSHVDVVRDAALGAVEVEEAAFAMAAPAPPGAVMMGAAAGGAGPQAELSQAKFRRAAAAPPPPRIAEATAAAPEAEVREVGDFCVFESPMPVSIAANRSAAIPVFNTALASAAIILHYKAENHPERPYRAIQFKNETPSSLGRGVCTVYDEGTYAGSCIIPATRPGGESLLPHALETGVRVRQERKRRRSKLVGLRLSEGVCYTSQHQSQDILYRVKNAKDEPFTLLVDHEFALSEPQIRCLVAREGESPQPQDVKESLKNGLRLSLDLAPQGELVLTISESRIQQSTMELVRTTPHQDELRVRWLEESLVLTNGPLAGDPGIRRCLELQQALDRKQQEISDAVTETDRLASRQERLRKNIGTGGHDQQTAQWRVELGEAESRINQLEEERIPKLRQDERTIRDELRDALRSLSAEWQTEPPHANRR